MISDCKITDKKKESQSQSIGKIGGIVTTVGYLSVGLRIESRFFYGKSEFSDHFSERVIKTV